MNDNQQPAIMKIKPISIIRRTLLAIIVSLVTLNGLISIPGIARAFSLANWFPKSNFFDFSPSVMGLCMTIVIPFAGIIASIVYTMCLQKLAINRILLGCIASGIFLWVLFAGLSQVQWLLLGIIIGMAVNGPILLIEGFWRFLTPGS